MRAIRKVELLNPLSCLRRQADFQLERIMGRSRERGQAASGGPAVLMRCSVGKFPDAAQTSGVRWQRSPTPPCVVPKFRFHTDEGFINKVPRLNQSAVDASLHRCTPESYRVLAVSASITTSKSPELSLRFPSLTPKNRTPSRWATKSRRPPTKIKSSLSSPMTAIRPPVG